MNVKIDSRKIEKGDTFVALRGIDHDGHAYIRQAIENGAAKIICCISDHPDSHGFV